MIARVILPLAVPGMFDYKVPTHLEAIATPGCRVTVVFGAGGKKMYTGMIREINPADARSEDTLSELDDIPDGQAVFTSFHLEFQAWIGHYYLCTPGEVLNAALPAGLKPESTGVISLKLPTESWVFDDLTVQQLAEELNIRPAITVAEAGALWAVTDPMRRLRRMEQLGYISMGMQMETRYKPQTERRVLPAPDFRAPDALAAVFDTLKLTPGQEEILLLVSAAWLRGDSISRKEIQKHLPNFQSPLQTLVRKGILTEEEVTVDRNVLQDVRLRDKVILFTAAQQSALGEIRESFRKHPQQPVLLHGITGSGKTELYIDLMREQLELGKRCLYLLPEIALTKQIIDKVVSAFGDRVGVYHSRFNEHERVEIFRKVSEGKYDIIIGVRSAILLPHHNIGLIVVDEEHDPSFKQQDPAPRYHCRDAAIVFAKRAQAHILLGSATPSFESWSNAHAGRYTLVSLPERATPGGLPEIRVADLRKLNPLDHGLFSPELITMIQDTVERKEQFILFQNRRGFAPTYVCTSCGTVPRCRHCDVSLVYHKGQNRLKCHYCGFSVLASTACTTCGSEGMVPEGAGTERVEEELLQILPALRLERMDTDALRSRKGFNRLLDRFVNRELDGLVGTQMVTKGLDFENVTLVGILDADRSLFFPDFRSYEHAYQQFTQVSGRAGRNVKKGTVLIQTRVPDHYVIRCIQAPFEEFYNIEMPFRLKAGYPPYTRVIRFHIRHTKEQVARDTALFFSTLLRPSFLGHLLGPVPAGIYRMMDEYRMELLLKLDRTWDAGRVRLTIQEAMKETMKKFGSKKVRLFADVDPV